VGAGGGATAKTSASICEGDGEPFSSKETLFFDSFFRSLCFSSSSASPSPSSLSFTSVALGRAASASEEAVPGCRPAFCRAAREAR